MTPPHPLLAPSRVSICWTCCALLTSLITLSLTALSLTSPHPSLAQDWPTPSGNYSRDRAASGSLPGHLLTPIWTILSTGLPLSVQWGDIDGDPDLEALIVAGGRVFAWSSDGSREWTSLPLDIVRVAPPVDLNGDGRPEIIAFRNISGLVILNGLNGAEFWRTPTDLSIVRKVLIADLDGDGLPNDILIPEADCGALSRNVGRAIAYHVSPDLSLHERFRLSESTRDYHCSAGMAIADIDGDGAQEVIAVGNEHLYIYSGQTGALRSASAIGWVPFGNADVIPVQADTDAAQELLLLTNNSAAPTINSRRALLLDQADPQTSSLTPRWQVSAANVSLDQHAWPSAPIADLHNDGTLSLVHAFWDHVTARWETRVTDLHTGDTLHRLSGRAVGLSQAPSGGPWQLFLSDTTQDTVHVLQADAGGWLPVASLPGDSVVEETYRFDPSSGRLLNRPLYTGDAIWIADNRDADGQLLLLPTYRVLTLDGVIKGEMTARRGEMLYFGQYLGEGIGLGVSEEGEMRWVDGVLGDLGVGGGGFRVPLGVLEAVMVGWSPGLGALVAGRGQRTFDLSGVNLATSAGVTLWDHSLLGWLDTRGVDGHVTWVGVDVQRRAQTLDLLAWRDDGEVRWALDNLISTQDVSLSFVAPAIGHDIDGDRVQDVLLQRADQGRDVFMLEPLSGLSGEALWPAAFEAGPSSTGAGQPLVVRGAHGEASRVVFAHNVMTLHDPETGVVMGTSVEPVVFAVLGGALATGEDEVTIAGAILHGRWRAIAGNGARIWAQNSLLNGFQRYTGNGAALVQGLSGRYVVESRTARVPFDHNLVVLDAQTGAVRHRLNLEGGEVKPVVIGQAVTNSLRAGVGVSTPEGARYLVGDSAGYLYLVDIEAPPGADPSVLLHSVWSFGEAVGDVSVANMDDDEGLELLVPLADGRTLMMDAPTLPAIASVNDVSCEGGFGGGDVDEVAATDVFCAEWSAPAPAPAGYVVTLEHEASGSMVAGPLSVTQPLVMFDNLRLIPGQRYRVVVQGYVGAGVTAGSSPIARSDGAEVVLPTLPPTITLTVNPDAFFAEIESSLISATLADGSSLASYALWIEGPSAEVVFEQSQLLNTTRHTVSVEWRGLDDLGAPLPPGMYWVYVDATDATGLSSIAAAEVRLLDPSAPPDDISGGDAADDVTTTDISADVATASEAEDADTASDLGLLDTMTAEDTSAADTHPTDLDTAQDDTYTPSEDTTTDASSAEDTLTTAQDTSHPTPNATDTAPDATSPPPEEVVSACQCSATRRPRPLHPAIALAAALSAASLWAQARRRARPQSLC